MDVRHSKKTWMFYSILWMSLQITACGSQKSAMEAFPEPPVRKGNVSCEAQKITNSFIVRWNSGDITLEKAENRDALLRDFVEPHLADIDLVEYNYHLPLELPQLTPQSDSDTLTEDWGQQMVQAPQVWADGVEGKDVVVAVVDTGADTDHPQLSGQLAVNSTEVDGNGVDEDGNSFADDVHGWDFVNQSPNVADNVGHGTHVSGIILADGTRGRAKGIAPKAKLLPVKFIDKNLSTGKDTGGTIDQAIAAIKYAQAKGAKVINASWGGTFCSQILRTTIEELAPQNILFVTAAGNSTSNIDQYPEYPAAFAIANMLTVIAITPDSHMASFTNFGFVSTNLAAPGYKIFGLKPGSSYQSLSGTSMATPFVSGAAALLYGLRPKATVAQIRDAILNSVDPGSYSTSSKGSLNLVKAVTEIKRLPE